MIENGNNSAKNNFFKNVIVLGHFRKRNESVSKGFPIGYEMAEKNANTQTQTHTNKHFRIYISRDLRKCFSC